MKSWTHLAAAATCMTAVLAGPLPGQADAVEFERVCASMATAFEADVDLVQRAITAIVNATGRSLDDTRAMLSELLGKVRDAEQDPNELLALFVDDGDAIALMRIAGLEALRSLHKMTDAVRKADEAFAGLDVQLRKIAEVESMDAYDASLARRPRVRKSKTAAKFRKLSRCRRGVLLELRTMWIGLRRFRCSHCGATDYVHEEAR